MTSIPIVFLYNSKYYKATVSKIPGAPVRYTFFSADPPLFIKAPLIFVSDPSADELVYPSNELNHAIAAAIIDSCRILDEPLHV